MTPAINLLKKLKIPHKLYPYECKAHDDFSKHVAAQLGMVSKPPLSYHDKQAMEVIIPSPCISMITRSADRQSRDAETYRI
ncbi:YbaK/EbsC family protein [Aeromonas hydrophila]|uniref:hypothetical protein n=1 Tax=Aeromonas hydrophila TaxID=644 RepID=UPI00384ECC25